MIGGALIREARMRAGLSQSELAERAGTAQPGIARWESGRTAVSLEEVRRLIRLCGLRLEVAIVEPDDSDLAQAERLAELTPDARVRRHHRVASQLRGVREASR